MRFSGLFQFYPFLVNFLLFSEFKTKLIKFCIKFQIEEAKILPSKFTSLQQTSTAILPVFFQKYLQKVLAVRVNETKLTSRNVFIVNLALGSEKESENDQMAIFWACPRALDLSLNTQRLKTTYIRFFGLFLFSAIFLPSPIALELKNKLINFCTRFLVKQTKCLN